MRTASKQRTSSLRLDDQRLKTRFTLALPAEAAPVECPSRIVHGHTTNLSSSGFTLILNEKDAGILSAEDRIQFEIEMARGDPTTPTVLLRGTGRVVRTARDPEGAAVAVKIRRKHLLNYGFGFKQV